MSTSHAIRNTVVGTVLGGLILTLILWLLNLLRPLTDTLWQLLTSTAGLLTVGVEIPLWLLLVLFVVLLWIAGRGLREWRSPRAAAPIEPSLAGLDELKTKMLNILLAADGDRVGISVLTSVTGNTRLEVESAMEALETRELVDSHWNTVRGTSWTLTSEGRDLLLARPQEADSR